MRRYNEKHPATTRRTKVKHMAASNESAPRQRAGFTLIELVIVMIILSVIAAMAIPKLNLAQYRADAAAQQVRSVFQTAQRTSLTRQYDVIVSVDTMQFGLRIAEDVNNDGTIQPSEWKFWRPAGEGNRFAVPPKGVNFASPSSSVVGTALTQVGGLPSIKLPAMGMVLAIYALTLIGARAGSEFKLKEVLILATILVLGSYLVFILLLKLQIQVWPTFISG